MPTPSEKLIAIDHINGSYYCELCIIMLSEVIFILYLVCKNEHIFLMITDDVSIKF